MYQADAKNRFKICRENYLIFGFALVPGYRNCFGTRTLLKLVNLPRKSFSSCVVSINLDALGQLAHFAEKKENYDSGLTTSKEERKQQFWFENF